LTPDDLNGKIRSVDRIIERGSIDTKEGPMSTIANAIERLESVLQRRHDFGIGTSRSVTTLVDGLHCSSEEGAWEISSDLPDSLGGSGSAPTPGVLLRSALGSCMAMSYQLRAARHGVELTSIRVTVEADSEISGMLLVDADAPPGYTELRCHVEIESKAEPGDVLRIIDEGDRLSPLLDVFVRTNVVRRTTSIRSGEN
jgi:uncharacterized OsmC-like protein